MHITRPTLFQSWKLNHQWNFILLSVKLAEMWCLCLLRWDGYGSHLELHYFETSTHMQKNKIITRQNYISPVWDMCFCNLTVLNKTLPLRSCLCWSRSTTCKNLLALCVTCEKGFPLRLHILWTRDCRDSRMKFRIIERWLPVRDLL